MGTTIREPRGASRPTPRGGAKGRGRGRFLRSRLGALVLAVFPSPARAAEAPETALTVRLVRPQEQGERLIDLFRGARAPNPAAALAAWKHATGGRGSLGKPLEAAVAALNPAMVREFRGLDGAEFALGFAPTTGSARWRATVPNDDDSFAALASALALTDGAVEEPFGSAPVLRVGPAGAPLAAVRDGRLALGSTREELRAALDRLHTPPAPEPGPSGVRARLDPDGLRGLTSPAGRRLSAWFDALGYTEADGRLSLDGAALTCEVTARLNPAAPGVSPPVLDPSWLDTIPSAGVVAAAAAALDTSAGSLDAAFAALDRVDRADPARAGVAPLRTRLNLLAAAARVRPEADLWPNLKGVTAAFLVDDAGRPSGAVVALHATTPDAAGRIARDVLPRLSASFLAGRKADNQGQPAADGVTPLGTVDGRPLSCTTRGRTVLIGWGDGSLAAALEASEHPERSAGAALREGWGAVPPQRAGGLWVGRLRAVAAPGSPLALALAASPPVVWQGRNAGATARDVARWPGLDTTVRRWLDALPLEPPPDR